MKYNKCIVGLFILALAVSSCTKNDDSGPNVPVEPSIKLQYPDSVFFVNGQQEDYIIKPLTGVKGRYAGFPDGIEIDEQTGAVNVSKSEAGLKYMITLIPDGETDTLSAFITISGINYLDGFYRLNTADSIAHPLYNANAGTGIPGLNNGSLFDIGSGCNDNGCNVIPASAEINLAQTVRNEVFGKKPSNNDRHEFELVYQINDESGKATNRLKVKLYYFEKMSDVTPEAYDIISSRQGTIIDANNPPPLSMAVQRKAAKPRPPCIFIVGN